MFIVNVYFLFCMFYVPFGNQSDCLGLIKELTYIAIANP